MKFLAGLVTAFMIAASLTVGVTAAASASPAPASAVSADPYGPKIKTVCTVKALKPRPRMIKLKYAIRTNGAPVKTNVTIKVRNTKGKVVRTLKRKTKGFAFRYMTFKKFKNKPGKYTLTLVAKPRGADADRFKSCSSRVKAKVKKLKK